MKEAAFDRDLLARHLRSKIDAEKKSVRTAAGEIGCSPATLSRMLDGEAAPNFPDARNIFRATSWLEKSVTDFEPGAIVSSSSLADVEVHLRALPKLSEDDKEALVAMVKALHNAAIDVRTKKG